MEKLLNRYDKEYMKMAMLKHEQTFRQQVCELHRLYRIQKILMEGITENPRTDLHYTTNPNQAEACRQCPGPTQPFIVQEFNISESRRGGLGGECRGSEIEDDQSDLELTLGSRSYYQKKIKASEPEPRSDSGTSFSSSSTGSNHVNGKRKEQLSRQKWGLQATMPVSNQDRLNSPPWLLQAPSLNLT